MTPCEQTPGPAQTPATPATPGGDPVRTSLERQLHILGDLAEAGLVMAQAVAREASGLQAGQPSSSRAVADLALAYERVARAVRYAAMLQSRLIGELRAWEQAEASPAAMAAWRARAEREAQAAEAAARKAEVAGVLERVVAGAQADQPETERRETLGREAAERLRSDPRLNDILTLPVSEVIDLICRDLGVQPDWLRLSEEEWARGELRSGKVGAALAAAVLSGAPPDDPQSDPSAEAGGPEVGASRTPLSRPSWRPPLRAAQPPRRRRATG